MAKKAKPKLPWTIKQDDSYWSVNEPGYPDDLDMAARPTLEAAKDHIADYFDEGTTRRLKVRIYRQVKDEAVVEDITLSVKGRRELPQEEEE